MTRPRVMRRIRVWGAALLLGRRKGPYPDGRLPRKARVRGGSRDL